MWIWEGKTFETLDIRDQWIIAANTAKAKSKSTRKLFVKPNKLDDLSVWFIKNNFLLLSVYKNLGSQLLIRKNESYRKALLRCLKCTYSVVSYSQFSSHSFGGQCWYALYVHISVTVHVGETSFSGYYLRTRVGVCSLYCTGQTNEDGMIERKAANWLVSVCVDDVRIRTKGPSHPIQSSPIAFSYLNTLYWQLPPCN